MINKLKISVVFLLTGNWSFLRMAKDDKFKEALGNRLRSLRLDAGFTLVELAEKSGVSYRTIIDIEKADTRPSVEVIRLLCNALKYPLPDFFKFKY